MEHDEVIPFLQRAWRRRDPSEERQPENGIDLVLVTHASIQCFRQKGERKAHDRAEEEAENGIALRSRPNLLCAVGGLDNAGDAGHEPPDRGELSLLLE